MSETKAREGQWYADRVNHEFFLVIAVDETDGVIDVRDRYGDIDEFDLDEWEAMDLVLCSAPTQWWPDEEWVDGEADGANGASHHFRSSGTT
jgi:hypothetical protein